MAVKYKIIIVPEYNKAVLVTNEDIEKGERFLYNKKFIMIAKNAINVHDNSSHYKVIATSPQLPTNENFPQIDINDVNIDENASEMDVEIETAISDNTKPFTVFSNPLINLTEKPIIKDGFIKVTKIL